MAQDGRAALVTGASSGFGAAIALELAAGGAAVLVAGRDRARGQAVVDEILARGGSAQLWLGDLREPARCRAAVAAADEAFGRLDVVVNNAGIFHIAGAEATTDEQWNDTLAINTSAVFHTSRAAIPIMRRQGGGAIVNIASDWGLVGGERAVAYCASKGAVVQMTRAMALDHARENIRVNAVCPGDCDTPMMDDELRQKGMDPQAGRRQIAEALPLGRIGTAQDVAHLVAFLASERAGFITGAAIPVDGGNTAR